MKTAGMCLPPFAPAPPVRLVRSFEASNIRLRSYRQIIRKYSTATGENNNTFFFGYENNYGGGEIFGKSKMPAVGFEPTTFHACNPAIAPLNHWAVLVLSKRAAADRGLQADFFSFVHFHYSTEFDCALPNIRYYSTATPRSEYSTSLRWFFSELGEGEEF